MAMPPGPLASEEWFFSYSSADRDIVSAIERLLASRGTRTFFDRNNLHAGLPWFDELEAALRRAT